MSAWANEGVWTDKMKITRFIRFALPTFLWFGLIFALSSQTHQTQDLRPWIHKEIPDQTVKNVFAGTSFHYGHSQISVKSSSPSGFIEFFIRKTAHIFVYFVLGLLIARTLKAYTNWSIYHVSLAAVSVSALYAASDEFHQRFIQGRTALPIDVLVDTAGAMLGIVCFLAVARK
ncbi:VanZ family protein [Paenibacillus roseipurpureus]|uniref:VanZ family protein n=1 Tax=Paenibacillus roseopurpureus TaxID=2918901 RepID=A0AA96RK16_9BACL|nr:VanZ family protein [Paenibacillus sp. MBLB1832]WNR43761.1 VanZ family protein [Paenibacillus sp. MBLB1832]